MEEQMHRANQMKVEQVKAKEKHDQEVKQMKQTVKVAATDKDDSLLSAGREPFPKSHIKKGLVKSILSLYRMHVVCQVYRN